jgi:hypothetical protein
MGTPGGKTSLGRPTNLSVGRKIKKNKEVKPYL